ncbi:ribitol 5-phosphate transferase FKRP-like [Babylonia areolata]|uniref:ribitol 5-phosphate transferase FKRP-like n=1 Tax=Babylonia areolata TaxID=304850 RepID=UPI003FD3CCA4
MKRRLGKCAGLCLKTCECFGVSVVFRTARRLLKRRAVRLVLFLASVVLLVTVLHTRVLPGSMGYYHQDCYLQEVRRERMRFLLRRVVSVLNEENATYWLDFGTFLGAVREGDILAHDGDMDVSRLADDLKADGELVSRMQNKLSHDGITVTPLIARYVDVQTDLFRWQTTNNTSSGRPLLRVYYPFVPAWSLAEAISDYLLPKDIPPDLLFPLRRMSMCGVLASIPHRPIDFMKIRYPLTWYMSFPYKWKCWARRN